MEADDIGIARRWAGFYRERGFQPLPSRPDEKRPMCRFAEWWQARAPEDLFDRFATPNIQIMTGRHWRLLVIDVDGQAARTQWQGWSRGRIPATWVTHSGGDGWHLWFRLPPNYSKSLPKSMLWKGASEHSAIERLCDHSLVMAPPSIHPKTGNRYRFLDRYHSPEKVPMPADCPAWVLALAPIQTQTQGASFPHHHGHVGQTGRVPEVSRGWRPAVPVAELVRSWGVRITGQPSASGWIPCRSIDREDKHPSAAIHAESGYYVDQGSGVRMNLYDLAVRLSICRDRREAIALLGG